MGTRHQGRRAFDALLAASYASALHDARDAAVSRYVAAVREVDATQAPCAHAREGLAALDVAVAQASLDRLGVRS